MSQTTEKASTLWTIPAVPAAQDTFWQRLRHGVRRVQQRADWKQLMRADWVDHIMDLALTDQFHAKQGRSTGRWVAQREGWSLAVFLKRHYRLPWWHGWLAALWPERGWSPALQEWRHLHWARQQGVPVPAPVAVAEFIGPGGRLQSVLAIEELTGMLPLHEAIPAAARLLAADTFRRWKSGLSAELARLTRLLHDRRHSHQDLYLCHFFIPRTDLDRLVAWRGRVHLIDLHRLGHHPWAWPFYQVKDLAQLLYSSELSGVDARDRLHFWRAYLGSARGSRRARWLARATRLKWRRYRRHNAKSRAARAAAKPSTTDGET